MPNYVLRYSGKCNGEINVTQSKFFLQVTVKTLGYIWKYFAEFIRPYQWKVIPYHNDVKAKLTLICFVLQFWAIAWWGLICLWWCLRQDIIYLESDLILKHRRKVALATSLNSSLQINPNAANELYTQTHTQKVIFDYN